jgi:hypothetical protein
MSPLRGIILAKAAKTDHASRRGSPTRAGGTVAVRFRFAQVAFAALAVSALALSAAACGDDDDKDGTNIATIAAGGGTNPTTKATTKSVAASPTKAASGASPTRATGVTTPTRAAGAASPTSESNAPSPTPRPAAPTPTSPAGSADEQAVQASIDAINAATASVNADEFLKYVTDNGLRNVFFTTREEVMGNPGGIEDSDGFHPARITVNGNTAAAEGNLRNGGSTFESGITVQFVKEGGVWKVEDATASDAASPTGAAVVSVKMKEFGFEFDAAGITSAGPIIFDIENAGSQRHHLQLFKLPPSVRGTPAVFDLLGSANPPDGFDQIGGTNVYAPGTKAKAAINEKLAPGHYVFLCFLPDTEGDGDAHFVKGMLSEFDVK